MSRPAQGVDTARVTGLVFHPAHSVTRLVSRLDHSIVNGRVTGLLCHPDYSHSEDNVRVTRRLCHPAHSVMVG